MKKAIIAAVLILTICLPPKRAESWIFIGVPAGALIASAVLHASVAAVGLYYWLRPGGQHSANTGGVSRPSNVDWVTLEDGLPVEKHKDVTGKIPVSTIRDKANADPSKYPNLKNTLSTPVYVDQFDTAINMQTGTIMSNGTYVKLADNSVYRINSLVYNGNQSGSVTYSTPTFVAPSYITYESSIGGGQIHKTTYNASLISPGSVPGPHTSSDSEIVHTLTGAMNTSVNTPVKSTYQGELDKLFNESDVNPTFTDDTTGLPFASPTGVLSEQETVTANNNAAAAEAAAIAAAAAKTTAQNATNTATASAAASAAARTAAAAALAQAKANPNNPLMQSQAAQANAAATRAAIQAAADAKDAQTAITAAAALNPNDSQIATFTDTVTTSANQAKSDMDAAGANTKNAAAASLAAAAQAAASNAAAAHAAADAAASAAAAAPGDAAAQAAAAAAAAAANNADRQAAAAAAAAANAAADAVKETKENDASTAATTAVNGAGGAYDSNVESPAKKSITELLGSMFSNSPMGSMIRSFTISTGSPVKSVSCGTVYGSEFRLNFERYEDTFNTLGGVLLVISHGFAILVVVRGW